MFSSGIPNSPFIPDEQYDKSQKRMQVFCSPFHVCLLEIVLSRPFWRVLSIARLYVIEDGGDSTWRESEGSAMPGTRTGPSRFNVQHSPDEQILEVSGPAAARRLF